MMSFKQFNKAKPVKPVEKTVKAKVISKDPDHKKTTTTGEKATKPLNRKPFGDPQFATQSARVAANQ